jgi:hypothetical protein
LLAFLHPLIGSEWRLATLGSIKRRLVPGMAAADEL